MPQLDLASMTLPEIEKYFEDLGEKKYRALQVFTWINRNLVKSFDDMLNIPQSLREKLISEAFITTSKLISKRDSKDACTTKYLLELNNDTIIETVLMRQSYGNTLCVSTQSGCRMGCSFCASTIGGLEKSLSSGEICAQVYEASRANEKVSNVVVMGMGEPFDNFDNLMSFIAIINSKDGINIGQRSITVSTCGICERIYDFAGAGTQVNLAISLHASNDYIRRQIMPIAKKYNISDIMDACRFYVEKTNRRISFEYALIKGVNDSLACARELSDLLKGGLYHVNLINYNTVNGKKFQASERLVSENFKNILKAKGIEVSVRRSMGNEIDGACGQLKRNYLLERN